MKIVRNALLLLMALPVVAFSKDEVDNIDSYLCTLSEECVALATAGYFEDRGNDDMGALQVMQVVINRSHHWKYPDTIKEVVFDKCNFSFVCDGSMENAQTEEGQWNRMYGLAHNLLSGQFKMENWGATHFHSPAAIPSWSRVFDKVGVVGSHSFYKCTGYC